MDLMHLCSFTQPELVSKGCFLLIPNYRAGSSRSHKYVCAMDGHANVSYGYESATRPAKKGVEEGPVNYGRVAITGSSRGGYLPTQQCRELRLCAHVTWKGV